MTTAPAEPFDAAIAIAIEWGEIQLAEKILADAHAAGERARAAARRALDRASAAAPDDLALAALTALAQTLTIGSPAPLGRPRADAVHDLLRALADAFGKTSGRHAASGRGPGLRFANAVLTRVSAERPELRGVLPTSLTEWRWRAALREVTRKRPSEVDHFLPHCRDADTSPKLRANLNA